MIRRVLVPTVALVALLAVAGCGGGADRLSKDEYAKRVAAAGDTLADTFTTIGSETSSLSTSDASSDEVLDQAAANIRKGSSALRSTADDLDDLEPPEDADDAHEKLVKGLRLLADDVDELADAVEDRKLEDITDLSAQLEDVASSEAGELLVEATDELKSKGYAIEGKD